MDGCDDNNKDAMKKSIFINNSNNNMNSGASGGGGGGDGGAAPESRTDYETLVVAEATVLGEETQQQQQQQPKYKADLSATNRNRQNKKNESGRRQRRQRQEENEHLRRRLEDEHLQRLAAEAAAAGSIGVAQSGNEVASKALDVFLQQKKSTGRAFAPPPAPMRAPALPLLNNTPLAAPGMHPHSAHSQQHFGTRQTGSDYTMSHQSTLPYNSGQGFVQPRASETPSKLAGFTAPNSHFYPTTTDAPSNSNTGAGPGMDWIQQQLAAAPQPSGSTRYARANPSSLEEPVDDERSLFHSPRRDSVRPPFNLANGHAISSMRQQQHSMSPAPHHVTRYLQPARASLPVYDDPALPLPGTRAPDPHTVTTNNQISRKQNAPTTVALLSSSGRSCSRDTSALAGQKSSTKQQQQQPRDANASAQSKKPSTADSVDSQDDDNLYNFSGEQCADIPFDDDEQRARHTLDGTPKRSNNSMTKHNGSNKKPKKHSQEFTSDEELKLWRAAPSIGVPPGEATKIDGKNLGFCFLTDFQREIVRGLMHKVAAHYVSKEMSTEEFDGVYHGKIVVDITETAAPGNVAVILHGCGADKLPVLHEKEAIPFSVAVAGRCDPLDGSTYMPPLEMHWCPKPLLMNVANDGSLDGTPVIDDLCNHLGSITAHQPKNFSWAIDAAAREQIISHYKEACLRKGLDSSVADIPGRLNRLAELEKERDDAITDLDLAIVGRSRFRKEMAEMESQVADMELEVEALKQSNPTGAELLEVKEAKADAETKVEEAETKMEALVDQIKMMRRHIQWYEENQPLPYGRQLVPPFPRAVTYEVDMEHADEDDSAGEDDSADDTDDDHGYIQG